MGQNMAKVPKPKTLLFHPLLWPKMLCLVWSNWFQPQIWLVPGHSNTQVSQPIWKSLWSYFLSWNWKSMWKSYILNIFCFLKFFGCLWFLGLYLVKNVHFLAILTKAYFCSHYLQIWTKNAIKTILNWIWNHFWLFVLMMGANTGFCQNCPKMDIFHKIKSQKSLTTKKFQN